jgi:two-component system capsular synthesis response regulator RcsB
MMLAEKKIVILDKNRLFMQGLHLLLEQDAGIPSVICCGNAGECLPFFHAGRTPDLLILGSVPSALPEDTMVLSRKIAQQQPLRILMVTDLVSSLPAFEVSAQVIARLTRRDARHTFLNTICDLFATPTIALPPPSAPVLGYARYRTVAAQHHFSFLLNEREIMVLKYFLQGFSMTKIALILSLSIKTVSYYKLSAQHKLGLKSNQDIYYYFRNLPLVGKRH